jgi:hypothetical protein
VDDLAVLTPSYRGDAGLFADLHASVLANTAPSVVHHVVAPPSDAHLFRQYEGPRCTVWTHRDLLPRHMVSVPHASGLTINTRRPWLPVRGWVTQQLMKLAGTAAIGARAVLIMDSDAVLLREVTLEDIAHDGRPWHFRRDDAVVAGMDRHLGWHNVARKLLAVPGRVTAPAPDYISPIAVWDPEIVRALMAHLADTTGKHWIDAVAGEVHVSEFMLYGVFADHVLDGVTSFQGPLCHNYYERSPLSFADAQEFASRMPSNALGAMISSHSRTPAEVRHDAFRYCAEVVGGYAGPLASRAREGSRRSPERRSIWEMRCLDLAIVLAEVCSISPIP